MFSNTAFEQGRLLGFIFIVKKRKVGDFFVTLVSIEDSVGFFLSVVIVKGRFSVQEEISFRFSTPWVRTCSAVLRNIHMRLLNVQTYATNICFAKHTQALLKRTPAPPRQ